MANEPENSIELLNTAELQFRLAQAVRIASVTGTQPADLPAVWSHGKHVVRGDEIALNPDEVDFAAHFLQQTATHMLAVAILGAIKANFENPKTHESEKVRAIYQISRMIRNSFTHRPFNPVWSIDGDCRDKAFSVDKIIELNTTGIDQQPFDWRHYGGPLALLRLSQFVRTELLPSKNRPSAGQ